MRPQDIELLAAPTSVTVHGELALVALSAPDLDAGGNRGGLHRVDLADGGATPWTHGDRDSAPVISPDGRWVAFLRVTGGKGAKGAESRPQLHVMPVGGGEARKVTALPGGAAEPVWAPDSRRIAFCARVPEAGRYGTASSDDGEVPEPAAEAPRRITRLFYRVDNVGFLTDQPMQVFVVDAFDDEPEPRQLTTGDGAPFDPAWSLDGTSVYVSAKRDWGLADTLLADLYAVSVNGGEPELVAKIEGVVSHPVALPDGSVVVVGDHLPLDERGRPQAEARNSGIWVVRPGAEPVRVTDEETVDCERAAGRPVPVPGGVLVAVRHRGAIELREVPLDGATRTLSQLPVLAGEQGAVKAFAAQGGRVVAVVSTPDTAGDVVVLDGAGESRVLTDFSAPLRSGGLRPLVEIKAAAPDGYPTHGWLVLPEGDGPHPVLLHVHGGPFMYHGWAFFDEAQVYAAAGYAVVLANPRGSSGYGQSHGQAIVRALGTVDVDDVLSVLDAALERSECDENRVGVMGGSYGGWMTGWLAAKHGDRFAAAWSERAVNAWDSFVGSSDIGWMFADGYCGYGPEAKTAVSPITYVDDVRIPFAIVHSEHDWRCPLEQAQRMYVALKQNGVETEMLIFPGEGHELSRSGRPRHRKQRFDAVLEWWSRHLPV